MLHIQLFGATFVTDDRGRTVSDLGGIKPRQILEILACTPGRPVPKDQLAELLWDGQPPRSYVGTLESYVCVLRRALGAGRGRSSAVATTSSGYTLVPSEARVDLADARRLMTDAATADPAEGIRLAEEAWALVRGDLLASEPYASWASHERTTFRAQMVETTTRASVRAFALGDFEGAIRHARNSVALDVLAEQAWQHLMRALWAQGRRCEALQAFFGLREAMLDELGAEPGRVSQSLYMDILRDRSEGGEDDERAEVRTLIGLLRQALEAAPTVRLTPSEAAVTTAARRTFNVA